MNKKKEKKEPKQVTAVPVYANAKEKIKALQDAAVAMQAGHKEWEPSSINLLSKKKVKPIAVIPTGIPGIDEDVLGIGGFPRGCVIEVYGPEGSGKTTIALQIIAEAQKAGGVAAFADAEHALNEHYAKDLGVDLDNLVLLTADNAEQMLEQICGLIDTGAVDVLVLDSVANLMPKAEMEGEIGDAHVGLLARLMTQASRKFGNSVKRTKTCLVLINQIREKIGVTYGSNETTPGGRSLRHTYSIRMDMRRVAQIKASSADNAPIIGHRLKVKTVKNRFASPFREGEFDLIYGKGVDKEMSLIEIGIRYGVIEKSGAWLSYKDERIGQGLRNAAAFLAATESVKSAVLSDVRAHRLQLDSKDPAPKSEDTKNEETTKTEGKK